MQVKKDYIATLDETFSLDALEIYNRQIPYNTEKLSYDQWMRRKKNNKKFAEVDLHEEDRKLRIEKADLCTETNIHIDNMTTARDLDHERFLRLTLMKPHRPVFGVGRCIFVLCSMTCSILETYFIGCLSPSYQF